MVKVVILGGNSRLNQVKDMVRDLPEVEVVTNDGMLEPISIVEAIENTKLGEIPMYKSGLEFSRGKHSKGKVHKRKK